MTLADLITRVEAGSGSDRKLDADICVALSYMHDVSNVTSIQTRMIGDAIWVYYACDGERDEYRDKAAPFTSSLDAIRALLKERLDGCHYTTSEHYRARTMLWNEAGDILANESNPDIHRAFLSAVLKAIAAKEG